MQTNDLNNVKKIYISVDGEPGSGKTSFIRFLETILPTLGFDTRRLSDGKDNEEDADYLEIVKRKELT